jgi:archaeosortase A (PGF-CTERM-specific)
MLDFILLFSFAAFVVFLIPGPQQRYAAIAGWTGLVLLLITEVPYYLSLSNLLYPVLAILSVPFLLITAKYLLKGDQAVLSLSRAAAVGYLIYAPFGFVPAIGEWLIGVVVGEVYAILTWLGIAITLMPGNIIARNNFRVEIILACTGIQGIAIMLGVASAVKTTLRQKVYAFLLIVPTIYLLNLARNVAVIVAYADQWFPYLPEIAGNGEYGYESFFWAHNIGAEGLALVLLIAIAYALFRIIPLLGDLAIRLSDLYLGEIRGIWNKIKVLSTITRR